MTHYVRDNETGHQDFALFVPQQAYNGTGASVALVLTDRHGGRVDTTGKVTWINQSAGHVRFSPAAGDLIAERGPYAACWQVTLDGRTYAFPSTRPDEWKVWR